MKTISFILTAAIFSTSWTTFAKNTNCDWPVIKKLKSGNLVSTYTFDYWAFAKANLPQYFKQQDLLQVGPVIGDFHFNNVGIYYNQAANKTDLAIIDLDDSGEASYLADYLKYLSYLKSITKDVDQKSLLKNYLDGLTAKSLLKSKDPMPDGIAELFEKSESWFAKKNANAVTKKMNSSQSKFSKKEELKDITQLNSSLQHLVSDLSAKIKVLDAGYKINSSGSSMGSLRIEVLGAKKEQPGLYEFKELRCAGTEMYQNQKNQTDRFKDMKVALHSEDFWGDSFIADATDESNVEQTFLFREKKENAFEDLDISHMKPGKLMAYANYYGFILGYFHGQSASKDYTKAIDKNLDQVLKAADLFSDQYLKQLQKKIKN